MQVLIDYLANNAGPLKWTEPKLETNKLVDMSQGSIQSSLLNQNNQF